MSSFFVVQVHTGFEIEVKEMLKTVLNRVGNQSVKCIYAMEKLTTVANPESCIEEIDKLGAEDVSEHLHTKRLQAGLTNLRNASQELKRHSNDPGALELLASYRESIRAITAQLKAARQSQKKISSVLNGYILVELTSNTTTFPADLMSIIKTVPKVVGMPSRNNVPEEEIEFFFSQIDVTPEIEIDFEELVEVESEFFAEYDANTKSSSQETEQVKSNENDKNDGTGSGNESVEVVNEIVSNIAYSLVVKDSVLKENQKQGIASAVKVLSWSSRKRRKSKVIMPVALFKKIYEDISIEKPFSTYIQAKDFVERLKEFVQVPVREGRVLLE